MKINSINCVSSCAAGILTKGAIFGLVWTLCVTIFYSNLVPNIILYGGLALFLICWCIEFVLEQRWHTKPNREWLFYGLLIVFYLWAFLYWPWDGKVYFQHHLEQRLPLLIFGFIGLWGLNNHFSKAIMINSMVIMSVGSVLLLFSKTGWTELIHTSDSSWLLSATRIKYINAHMGYNFFLNSTLIGMWYLLFHAERKPLLWQKIVYPIAACFIFAALLFSDGRSGFFMSLVIIGMMSSIEIYRWRKWAGIIYAIIVLSVIPQITTLHPRVSSLTLSSDLRYCYWKAASELIQEKPILGYGMSHAQEEFDRVNMKYATDEIRIFWTEEHSHYVDCHNQFIQTTLEYGIFGLILLLAIYLTPLYICRGRNEWWIAFFFTLISMGQSMFDMFITGRFNMIYCILMLMIISIKKDYNSDSAIL